MESHPQALGQALLRTEKQDESWRPPSNVDHFLLSFYRYYLERGFWCIVASRISSLITLGFTVLFTVFLALYVDWAALSRCAETTGCGSELLRSDPVSGHASAWSGIVLFYFALFCVFWLMQLLSSLKEIRDAWHMRHFFQRFMLVEDSKLPKIEWHELVAKLVQLQSVRPLSYAKVHTAIDVTNRIMRTDNYMIALINEGLLDYSLPCCPGASGAAGGDGEGAAARVSSATAEGYRPLQSARQAAAATAMRALTRERSDQSQHSQVSEEVPFTARLARRLSVYGTTLDYNVRVCIFGWMFDRDFRVNAAFKGAMGAEQLARRFRLFGLINLALVPFIMVIMLVYFFLKHAEEFHQRRQVVRQREWTLLARWKLREFCELQHLFEQRLKQCHRLAEKFVTQNTSPILVIIAQLVAYVSGAFVAVLLALAVSDSSVLVRAELQGARLIWWLTIFTILLAVSRALVPENDEPQNANEVVLELAKHTHYLPAHWIGRCDSPDVADEFDELYKGHLQVLVAEALSVLTAPFVLLFSLPRAAPRIVRFMEDCTVHAEGVGDLCVFGTFNLRRSGDPELQDRLGLEPEQMVRDEDELADTAQAALAGSERQQPPPPPPPPPPPLSNGKLERSLLTFSVNHPEWKPNANGSMLLRSVMRHGPQGGLAASRLDGSLAGSAAFAQGGLRQQTQAPGASALNNSFAELLAQDPDTLLPEMNRLEAASQMFGTLMRASVRPRPAAFPSIREDSGSGLHGSDEAKFEP